MARAEKLDLSAKADENPAKLANADWLVFADDSGVANKIVSKLGALNKECTIVKKGTGFNKISDTLIYPDESIIQLCLSAP